MRDADCIRWKVYDSDENLMRHCNPATTTKSADSYETLKRFLQGLKGEGFVLIVVFIRKATEEDGNGRTRMRKGGDTANSSFSFFYKIGSGDDARPVRELEAVTNKGNNDLMQRIFDLQLQMVEQKNSYELKQLRDELKEYRGAGKSYFTEAAEAMAQELYREWKKEKGIAGVNEKKTEPTQQPAPEPVQDSDRAIIKSCVKSAARVMQVAKQYGGDVSDVAQGFEDFAKLAETNPLKLAEIMQQLKAATGE